MGSSLLLILLANLREQGLQEKEVIFFSFLLSLSLQES